MGWFAALARRLFGVLPALLGAGWRADVRAAGTRRLTSSSQDSAGTVVQSPAALLARAREATGDADLSLDTYTLARMATSEYGRATPEVWAAVCDAEVNRAESKGKSLFSHLCPSGTFGKQGSPRPASTARDPHAAALAAARAVLDGRARGIARGAHRFFDPRVMDVMHKRDPGRVSCDAASLLSRWAYDRPRGPSATCPPADRVGDETEAWIGQVRGIDPWELMLMAPMDAGPAHDAAYQAALVVIRAGRAGLPTTVDGVLLVAALAAGVAAVLT